MKKILFFLGFILASTTFRGQNTVQEFEVNKKFVSKSYWSGSFNLSHMPEYLILRITGSDYDYDENNNFSNFKILVNNKKVISGKSLTDYGFGQDGGFKFTDFNITRYVKIGKNTIYLQNVNNVKNPDYVYISDLKILSVTASYFNDTLSADLNTKFDSQLSQSVTFKINKKFSKVTLYIYGSDYDYDEDHDFTDFTISINGRYLCDQESLASLGFGKNGKFITLGLDITKYVKQGSNKIKFQNTEDAGQTDYAYIQNIEIVINSAEK